MLKDGEKKTQQKQGNLNTFTANGKSKWITVKMEK